MYKLFLLISLLLLLGQMGTAVQAPAPAKEQPSMQSKVFGKVFFYRDHYIIALTNGQVLNLYVENQEAFKEWWERTQGEFSLEPTDDTEYPFQLITADGQTFLLETIPEDQSLFVGFKLMSRHHLGNIEEDRIQLISVTEKDFPIENEAEGQWWISYPEENERLTMDWKSGDEIVLAIAEVYTKKGDSVGFLGFMMLRFSHEDDEFKDEEGTVSGIWVKKE